MSKCTDSVSEALAEGSAQDRRHRAQQPRMAAAMARLVPADSQDLVVELGGGTGVITQALLEAGIAPARLIVVERDEALHDLLVKRFPR